MRRILQLVVPLATLSVAASPPMDRFEYAEPHMGTEFRLVFYATTARDAAEAASAAFHRVAYLDSLFSDYRADSEVARLAALSDADRVEVSDDLWAVLGQAQVWASRTDGAFDVTVGPLTRLWRWSARRGELPDRDRLDSARASVGFELLNVSADEPTISLARAGMSLDLGGLAKGFAADAALEVLEGLGIESVLVDAGGDIRLGAPPPGKEGWRVALPGGETLGVVERGRGHFRRSIQVRRGGRHSLLSRRGSSHGARRPQCTDGFGDRTGRDDRGRVVLGVDGVGREPRQNVACRARQRSRPRRWGRRPGRLPISLGRWSGPSPEQFDETS